MSDQMTFAPDTGAAETPAPMPLAKPSPGLLAGVPGRVRIVGKIRAFANRWKKRRMLAAWKAICGTSPRSLNPRVRTSMARFAKHSIRRSISRW